MKTIVKIADFYHPCRESFQYAKILGERNREAVLFSLLRESCELLKSRKPYSCIIESIRKKLASSYKEDWFAIPWQYKQSMEDDLYLFQRFFQWLGNVKVIDANVPVIAETQSFKLLMDTSLIVEKNGKMHAINIFPSKNKKSLYGKTVHTSSQSDLYALSAKLFFETSFPEIRVHNVYLKNEDDAPGNMVPVFLQTRKKNSNVFMLDDLAYYEDGIFDDSLLMETIEQVLAVPVQKDCFNCHYTAYCNQTTQVIKTPPVEEVAPAKYQVPNFTESQLKVIHHVDGPLLVCAGPGSGKTATLVGRIKYLMQEKQIPSEYLLAVTFTNDAANVLRERCATFCAPDDIPKISTLNALGYEILRQREDLIGTVKVLSKMEQMNILEHLVGDFPSIKGFHYDVLYGRNGLLSTLARKIEKYFSMSNEQFYQEEPTLGDDFRAFALRYKSIIKKEGYITFDEQISLCISLFKQYPEILENLQRRYRYIAVDEYQDINSVQDEFISLLAGKRANLVAVGDDDQSIYAFRGGSNRFMLQFTQRYPSAQIVILHENFRSTKALVESAETIIKRNQNRIQKDICSMRENGTEPILVSGIKKVTLEQTVSECLREGYSYDDIAILASKNATLKELRAVVEFPSILGKSYLIEDTFFLILYDMLLFFYKKNESALLHLGRLTNTVLHKEIFDNIGQKEVESAEQLFAGIFQSLHSMTPISFITAMSNASGWNGSASEESVLRLANEHNVTDLCQLFDLFSSMLRYGDETRVEKDVRGCVQFITSHESKGLEFPVVFLLDDFKIEETEEKNRLFYVSLTRAKEKFYLFQDKRSGLKGGIA